MMSSSSNRVNSAMYPPNTIPPQPHINPMFSTASRVHINPNFSASNAHPKAAPIYSSSTKHSSKVLLNPKFKASPPTSPKKPPAPSSHSMHINPKFANRPLPSVPPPPKPARSSLVRNVSLSTMSLPETSHVKENIYARVGEVPVIDRSKKEKFEESIKKSLENKTVLINPNFGGPQKTVHPSKPARTSLLVSAEMTQRLEQELEMNRRKEQETPKVSLDKENVPSAKSKMNLFTPLRKSAFKKIGSRKLVRVKRKSGGSPGTPNASFKKIGSKKLIRIQESAVKDKREGDKSSLYQVKTKTKIVKTVKNTPTNTSKYRFSFITPLSLRRPKVPKNSGSLKKSSGKKRLSSFRSRFKLDRRTKPAKAEPKVLFQSSNQPRLKKLSGTTYKVSATKLSKVTNHPPSKPHRTKHLAQPHPTLANSKVITVQGIKFSVADNGRKLKRLPSTIPSPSLSYSASVSQSCATSTSPGQASSSPQAEGKTSPVTINTSTTTTTSKKVYLGGEEFDEIEPGVFSRSRHSLTRQSITQAKNRSINTIIKNANRSKQYCMFYNKFGKCTKKETGSCPFLHDKDKVAVCRRFLQGSCVKDKCLLSHKVAPEKMPACKYFLEGVCSKEDCPYLHVKVSAKAEICQAFLKGYCSNGSDCKERHVMACPEFDRTGSCGRVGGKCPFPHVSKAGAQGRTPDTAKRIPPAKPKRKSLGQTPDHSTKKSRVQARYYEDRQVGEEEIVTVETDEMDAKRKRLLRKIELAKQGWTGVTVSVAKEGSSSGKLDDSGPYEKIDSDTSDDEGGGQGRVARQPIGQLGDFISLAGYSSEEEELCTDRRLI